MINLNKSIQQKQEQINKLNRDIEKLKKDLEKEQNKSEWIKISNKEEISAKQLYNNKTYAEIQKLLNKNELIADYTLLRDLRNKAFESNWTIYPFLKDFWVLVPQEDKASEKNNYVAGFSANSDGADLYCYGGPGGTDAGLGVFVVRSIK